MSHSPTRTFNAGLLPSEGRNPGFALTYPQIMNQAIASGIPSGELQGLRAAFEFSQQYADGLYRAPGVPLISHLTRTASILLAEQQPMTLVVSGLLHAAYIVQFFEGSTRRRLRPVQRRCIRNLFGNEVDRLLCEYHAIDWRETSDVQRYIDEFDTLSELRRNAVIVHLANDLEDMLDGALEFSSQKRRHRRSGEYVAMRMLLAKTLSLSLIENGFEALVSKPGTSPIPAALVLDRNAGYEMPARRLWQASMPERLLVGLHARFKRLRRSL